MLIVAEPTWTNAGHLLRVYDGSASELFVIDIPGDELVRVLSVIAELPDVLVNVCAGQVAEPPFALDDVLLARLAVPTTEESRHAFYSARDTSEHLQIYLHTPAGRGSFDVELVFWNDLTFPRLGDAELSRRLDRLVAIAEALRGATPSCRCIPSGEHNSDPRELLDDASVVVW